MKRDSFNSSALCLITNENTAGTGAAHHNDVSNTSIARKIMAATAIDRSSAKCILHSTLFHSALFRSDDDNGADGGDGDAINGNNACQRRRQLASLTRAKRAMHFVVVVVSESQIVMRKTTNFHHEKNANIETEVN